ncbi:hypothetical protein LNQ52_13150 [Klebsiella pneumoniae subsp. pneumoniae]|nr:hypothetical protein [Klebsiella pneumoniae subsp. pneumoniae]
MIRPAKLLGLDYPGGPMLSKMASQGHRRPLSSRVTDDRPSGAGLQLLRPGRPSPPTPFAATATMSKPAPTSPGRLRMRSSIR